MNMRIVCLLVLMLLMGIARAHDTNLVTIYTNQTPVLSDIDEHGTATGFAVEVAQQIIQRAGLQSDIKVVPFARVLKNSREKHRAVAPGLARTPARESEFHWITPILANQVTLYIHKDHTQVMSSIKTVAVQRDDFRHSIAQELGVETVVELSSWDHALQAVAKRRVDGFLFSPAGFKMLCYSNPAPCEQLVPFNTQRFFYNYLALGKLPGNEVLVSKLRIAAEQYKQSREYAALMKKTVQRYVDREFAASIQNKVLTLASKDERHTQNMQSGDERLWVLAEHTPYFAEPDNQGNVTGYAAYLMNEVLAKAGLPTPILLTSWPRIMREMEVKPNIMTFALGRTPERESNFHWITPVIRARHALFGLEGGYYDSLEKVPETKIIGGLEGDYRMAVANRHGLQTKQFLSWPEALQAVQDHKVDFIFVSSLALGLHCKANQHLCDNLKPVSPAESVTLYLAMSKQQTSPYLAERLRHAAMQVKDSSAHHARVKQWSAQMNEQGLLSVHVDGGVINLWAQD
ncbi:substrate-binding periplasmic protein [Salinimonas chungwhensis]|uniref:substrate-binding periplasmic protein n=1 Tax=Salinimonas chungwhensis TaxID=265425 RepID=UPI000376F4C2|nr:transporter substrate-binding domain-containing protein [Salinimonas chungwhensis]